MRALLIIFLVQLTVAAVLGQITFTREWATGKRSSQPYKKPVLNSKHPEAECKSLLPAIRYLIEVENRLQESCESREWLTGSVPIPQKQFSNDDPGDGGKNKENVNYVLQEHVKQ